MAAGSPSRAQRLESAVCSLCCSCCYAMLALLQLLLCHASSVAAVVMQRLESDMRESDLQAFSYCCVYEALRSLEAPARPQVELLGSFGPL